MDFIPKMDQQGGLGGAMLPVRPRFHFHFTLEMDSLERISN
jgi:hypothetical protein